MNFTFLLYSFNRLALLWFSRDRYAIEAQLNLLRQQVTTNVQPVTKVILSIITIQIVCLYIALFVCSQTSEADLDNLPC